MKIYVAGTRHDPRIADGSLVAELQRLGHTITSHWHDPGVREAEEARATYEDRLRIATANYRDLDAAELVLAVPYAGHHLRGAHAEIGYAIGVGKRVFVLGAPADFNTMTTHANVRYLAVLSELPR